MRITLAWHESARTRFQIIALGVSALLSLPSIASGAFGAIQDSETEQTRDATGDESETSNSKDGSLEKKKGDFTSEFESPQILKAENKIISVESPGYACPTMADLDGDGKLDLVVGQFRSGNMQFFKNVADSNQPPKFAAGQWLMGEEERLVVPGVW